MELKVGMEFELKEVVEYNTTAANVGSGGLEVFGTPYLIALIEKAAFYGVSDYLEKGYSTVGTVVNIEHISPSPIGANVCAKVVLVEIDGRRLVFSANVFDDHETIGKGMHERYIINEEKFMKKVNDKK